MGSMVKTWGFSACQFSGCLAFHLIATNGASGSSVLVGRTLIHIRLYGRRFCIHLFSLPPKRHSRHLICLSNSSAAPEGSACHSACGRKKNNTNYGKWEQILIKFSNKKAMKNGTRQDRKITQHTHKLGEMSTVNCGKNRKMKAQQNFPKNQLFMCLVIRAMSHSISTN